MRILMLFAVLGGILLGATWPAAERQPVQANVAAKDGKPRKTVLERSRGGFFYVTALVNGVPIEFVVDTGAELVALTKHDAARARIAFDPAKFEPVAETASGVGHGQLVHIASIDLDGKRRDDVGGMVIEGLGVSLLGQNYLQRLDGIEMAGDRMILR